MGSLAARLSRAGPAEPDRVRQMLDAAPHRGGRQQVREHGAVALGVSQDDEVADGSISTGNGLVAAFSGRLDNAADLRQQLAAHGRAAAGETPADIVEEAFRVWGEGAPARLRGQFAAAVTDGERIWSFRDQVGFRAVHYREDGLAVHLASEAKQVLAGAGIPREPDLDAVEHIFYGTGGGADADCAVKGVKRMAAATVLSHDRGGRRRADRYWEPEQLVETGRFTSAEAEERFAELFDRAVGRCLTGNDGVSLVGGHRFAGRRRVRRSRTRAAIRHTGRGVVGRVSRPAQRGRERLDLAGGGASGHAAAHLPAAGQGPRRRAALG